MVKRLFVLFEHSSGFALFRVKQIEEIGAFNVAQVEESHEDASLFMTNVKLVAFSPFESALNALENVNAVSEGVLHSDLKSFLDAYLPADADKRSKVLLGVTGASLAQALNEKMGLSVKTGDIVPELMRGIRTLFPRMLKDLLSPAKERQAQLGLGHAFSRSKVKFNVNRADNMIIHSIALLDQLHKDVNTFSMRIREWYGYHFPELYAIVPDNYTFARVLTLIGDRVALCHRLANNDEATSEMTEKLNQITMDDVKSKGILNAARTSMGMELSEADFENIGMFAAQVIHLHEYRQDLFVYLTEKMGVVAPNLTAVVGQQVGARLISHAGSLTNLAKYPASTIQILGAEKALFRALKTKSATPKYGILFHSSLIGKAKRATKGRVSRNLANKCAIASRIDCFSDIPTNCYGIKLRELIEQRMKYYEESETNENAQRPALTSEVMEQANELANDERNNLALEKARRKAAKKAKKAAARLNKAKEETTFSENEFNKLAEKVNSVKISNPKQKNANLTNEKVQDEPMDIDD